MIVEYIRYAVGPERAEAFEAAYAVAQGSLEASPHCLRYEVARCVEEPGVYVVRIEWDSQEGHLRGFRASPEFRTFFAAVRPFVGDITEMRHYEATAIRGGTA
jgi:quinol monooxygenase YgiN